MSAVFYVMDRSRPAGEQFRGRVSARDESEALAVFGAGDDLEALTESEWDRDPGRAKA